MPELVLYAPDNPSHAGSFRLRAQAVRAIRQQSKRQEARAGLAPIMAWSPRLWNRYSGGKRDTLED